MVLPQETFSHITLGTERPADDGKDRLREFKPIVVGVDRNFSFSFPTKLIKNSFTNFSQPSIPAALAVKPTRREESADKTVFNKPHHARSHKVN